MNPTMEKEFLAATDNRVGAVEEVYQEIKRMMYRHILVPGQKLGYQDLARKLGVSVTPVIQALKGLERQSFVRYETNRGYFVGEITEIEAKELFEARIALETYSIPLVIENWNKEKAKELKRAYEEHLVSTRPENRRILLLMRDAQFHLKLVECAGNRVIYNLLNDVFEHINLRYRPEYLLEKRTIEAAKEHLDITDALEKAEENKVIRLVKEHIKNGRDHILYCMRSVEVEIFE